MTDSAVLLPGATIGMLGGGQLGRMFVIAARNMGYRVVVLDPDSDSPAGRIADEHIAAAYQDEWALKQMASCCDAITTEFENIPATTLRYFEGSCPVRPSASALENTQNRIREKSFLREHGLATAEFFVIKNEADIAAAMPQLNDAAVLKVASFGYDGKGQSVVSSVDEAVAVFQNMGSVPCVLEQKIQLKIELSIVLVRTANAEVQCYPASENIHEQGILDVSVVPARVANELAEEAKAMAMKTAELLDYCGVMAVEFFVDTDGRLMINEIAPRPHNSGHYTLDAAAVSQFEQQVRAVCGLPAGSTALLSPVVMVNMLGDLWGDDRPDWSSLLSDPDVKLHLYGKAHARVGRKMGHFNVLSSTLDAALFKAKALKLRLQAFVK